MKLLVLIATYLFGVLWGYSIGYDKSQRNCQQIVSNTNPPPAPTIILSEATVNKGEK